VAVGVAVVLAGPVVPAYADPAAAASSGPAARPLTAGEALTQARRSGRAVEVVGSTTATQTVTALPSGRLRVTTSLVPVRKYAGGRWRDLDATLHRNGDGSISPAVSTSELRLSGGGSGPLARMRTQGHTLALSLPVTVAAPTLSGDTATYAGILPGVDLVVRADRQGGFSQVLVVHSAAAAAHPALGSLLMGTGGDLTVAAQPDGALDAVDSHGRPMFTAGVPVMWDSTASHRVTAADVRTGRAIDVATGLVAASDARGPGVAARRARVGVSVTDAGVRLVPDAAMLAGRGVTFPLFIDPTWTPVSPTRSAWATVSHSYPGSFYWNKTPDPDGHLQVGNSNEALLPNGIWSRSFLNFAIPVSTLQGATINSAVLNMTQVHAWSCTPSTVNIYAPAATLTSGNASWNSWVGVSLGGVVDAKSEAHGRTGCPADGVSFNVLGPINAAVASGKTTQTFTLTGVNEASDFNSYKEFDLNTVAMTVEYNHAPNTPGAAQLTTSPPTSCLKSPADVVGLGNVSLYAQVSDPETSNILGVEFQLWRSDDPATVVAFSDPGLLTVASGSTAVLVVQRSTLVTAANGASMAEFSWKVRAKDDNVFGNWSPVCKFSFDQSTLGAPNVPEIAENTTTIGQPKTLTVAKPDGTTIPSGYLVQLNGGAPSSAQADAAGNASITFTPTRHTNVLSVVSLSPGGNVGSSTQRIFVSNPGPTMPDGDLTGDGVDDFLAVGGTNSLTSGLWLATGRNTGQISPAATNIGVRGIGLGKHDNQTDYDNAIALTGHFFGSGQQDVLVYLPTGYRSDGSNAGGGSIIEGRGDGSILNPINQATISAGQFEFGDGSPVQLANAGDSTGRGLAYPDLIGIVGSGEASYLDYFPNNNMVGGWGASRDRLVAVPPSGVWSDWTIASAQVAGGTSLYLWNRTTGGLYLWTGLNHTMDDSDLTYTQYAIATDGWNTGAGLTLSAGDIDGDGDADLWTVDGSAAVRSHLVSISAAPTLTSQPAQGLTTAKHIWSLSDAPPEMGTVTVAHDQVGTADFTGYGGASWNTGDLFSPDVEFGGGVLYGTTTINAAADFSVSMWVKPMQVGGVMLGQGGMRGYNMEIYTSATDNSWKLAMSTSDTYFPVWDYASAGANTVQLGVWTHLTATYQRSTGAMKLYVNGVLAGTGTHTSAWGGSNLTLGGLIKYRTSPSNYFKGQLANVQVWDSVVDPTSPAGYYQPIAMKRLLDTRDGTGGLTGPLAAGSAYKLKVAGAGGIPATNVTAVVLAISVLNSLGAGYITLYPDNTPKPDTSTLNWVAGIVPSNTAVVPVGANGYIDIFVNGNATHVVADAEGYFTSDPSAANNTTYTPVKSTRFLDTRDGTGGTLGKIPGGGVKVLQVGGVTVGSTTIPSGVKAVALNLVGLNQASQGWMVTYADGTPRPVASNLQYPPTGPMANLEIVPVGANGKIDIFTTHQVDMIGDIVGYFTAGTAGQKFHSIPATRMVDTRVDGGAIAVNATKKVTQGIAIVAQAPTLILNGTVTGPVGTGYLVAYPDGPMPSPASTINFAASQTVSNLILGATNGGVVNFTNASSGTTHLIVDCMGYLSAY